MIEFAIVDRCGWYLQRTTEGGGSRLWARVPTLTWSTRRGAVSTAREEFGRVLAKFLGVRVAPVCRSGDGSGVKSRSRPIYHAVRIRRVAGGHVACYVW